MQDARNQNTTAPQSIEYNALTMLMTSQAGANIVTGSTEPRVLSKHLETNLKLTEIHSGLIHTPLL